MEYFFYLLFHLTRPRSWNNNTNLPCAAGCYSCCNNTIIPIFKFMKQAALCLQLSSRHIFIRIYCCYYIIHWLCSDKNFINNFRRQYKFLRFNCIYYNSNNNESLTKTFVFRYVLADSD